MGATLLTFLTWLGFSVASLTSAAVGAVWTIWLRLYSRAVALFLAAGLLGWFLSYAFNKIVLYGASLTVDFSILTAEQFAFLEWCVYASGLDWILGLSLILLPVRILIGRMTIPVL